MCEGFSVVGIDNLNDYYDPALKQMRLLALNETQQAESAEFEFLEMDLAERQAISACSIGQNSMWSSIWRRKLECATHWKTLMLMLMPI